jgi:hypothetical protein
MRTVILDSQILSGIQKCAAYTNFKFNLHLRQPETPAGIQRGNIVHTFFSGYYNARKESGNTKPFIDCYADGMKPAKAFAATCTIDESDINRVFRALEQYVDHYKWEPMEVLVVESPFALTLYENEEEDLRIVYVGMTDLIAKLDTTGENRVYDHKTQSVKSDFLELDDQFTGYALASETNILYVNVIGLQETVKFTEKSRRIPLSYPDSKKDLWKSHVVYWVKQYLIYAETQEWPENHQGCRNRYHQVCEYYEVCNSVTQQAKVWKLANSYIVGEPWDPTKTLENRE